MTTDDRIHVLSALGAYLQKFDERLMAHVHRASTDNPWFTDENIRYAIWQVCEKMLREDALETWTAVMQTTNTPRRIGLIMAGNIPLAGFHDLLCVFISGNVSVIKLSDKDKYLIPFFIKVLEETDPRTAAYFEIVDKLPQIDAVIATGSNNSARYFEYYFSKYPHIIRKNRNAVAVLDGHETKEDLAGLSTDIFMYFGLGCRSVSHCYVPEGYDFEPLVTELRKNDQAVHHNKYKNNLDYHLAIHILNRTTHTALPSLILMENEALVSPVGCLFFSYYSDLEMLKSELQSVQEEIQCVVTNLVIPGLACVPFGMAQRPELDDYADGVDTMAFLQSLAT